MLVVIKETGRKKKAQSLTHNANMPLGPYHTYRFAGFRNSLDSHIYFLNHTKISGYRESSSCLAHLTFNV